MFDLNTTLKKLQNAGILGAKEAHDMYVKGDAKHIKDCATILESVNGPGVSDKFDTLLRTVHQYGLSRFEDIQLLLQVYSEAFDETVAHEAYSSTLKGALFDDWRLQYTHVTLRYSLLSTLIFGVAYAVLKVMMVADENTPFQTKLNPPYIAYVAALNLGYVVCYHMLAFGIASTFLLTIFSFIRLCIVAIRTIGRDKIKVKLKYTVSWVIVNIICFFVLVALSLFGFTFPYLIMLMSAVLSSMIGGVCCSLDCECRLNGPQVNKIISKILLRVVPRSALKSYKQLFKETSKS